MPAYLELTDLRVSDKPKHAGLILPSKSVVLGNDGEDNWLVARCHRFDICTHLFKIASEEPLGIVDGEPVTETGDAVELELEDVIEQVEDGEAVQVGSADTLDSGLLVVANKLLVRHTVLLSPDNGGQEFYH